jgi:hypothetical protein
VLTRALRPRQANANPDDASVFAVGRILAISAFNSQLTSALATDRAGVANAQFQVLGQRLNVCLASPDGITRLPRKPERDPYLLGLAVAAFQGIEQGYDKAMHELRTARALALLQCTTGDWDQITVNEEMPYGGAKIIAMSRQGSSAIRHIEGEDALPPTISLDVYQTPAMDNEPVTVVHLTARTTMINPSDMGPLERLRYYNLWGSRHQ